MAKSSVNLSKLYEKMDSRRMTRLADVAKAVRNRPAAHNEKSPPKKVTATSN